MKCAQANYNYFVYPELAITFKLPEWQNLTTSEKTPTTTEAFFISIPFLDKSATTKTTVYQKKQIIQELPIICTAERKEDDI